MLKYSVLNWTLKGYIRGDVAKIIKPVSASMSHAVAGADKEEFKGVA